MYFHVYLIYRFTRTFTDHSSVITRCWGFELQNGKSSLKSQQTLATQDFAPASFLSTPDTSEQTSYRLLRLFYKSQSALTPLLLLSKPNPLSLGFGLGPPLRGGFVLLQENIGRNQPFHIVFSPSEYIPSVDEHKSSGAGTIKCRTARNRWEGVRFFWTVSHTDVSLKGVVPDGRKKQAYPACAHCQERMK